MNPPFKNDGGGSYSGGDFIIPIMNFEILIKKYLQLKYFLYIYIERNEERHTANFFCLMLVIKIRKTKSLVNI